MTTPAVFPVEPLEAYALLDSGLGEKLERVGPLILRRPDPQAMWRPALSTETWDAADLTFVRESDRGGRWAPGAALQGALPELWEIPCRGLRLLIRPTPFKHIGLFPEQAPNWTWTAARLKALTAAHGFGAAQAAASGGGGGNLEQPVDRRPRLLNLFAYTGVATILATRSGAFVTHVDASRPALRWAKENARLSGLAKDAVRWIEDDALAFAQREVRRGQRYAGILLDPPPYGRGPKSQRWIFEEQIVELLATCARLLVDGPAFCALSCYAVGTSPLAFANMLAELGEGTIEAGELAIPHERSDRLLPAGLCGRWVRI